MRDDALIRVFAITAALLGSATAAGADLLTACASEVTEFCADVDEGDGRVVACLASRSEKLRAGCLSEVQAAAQSPLVPEGARRMFDPTFRADLPPACEAAVSSLCPGVMPGSGSRMRRDFRSEDCGGIGIILIDGRYRAAPGNTLGLVWGVE